MDILVSLVSYGLLDALNPTTIATLIVLLALVKHKWHADLFIWGTFFTYLGLGLAGYYGIHAYAKEWLIDFYSHYQAQLAWAELVAGLGLLGWVMVRFIRLLTSGAAPSKVAQRPLHLRTVQPWAIAGLAVMATLQDFPTALPYFWFLALLTGTSHAGLTVVGLLATYCWLYILPMLILSICYSRFREKFARAEHWVQRLTHWAMYYGLPLLLLIGGVWLVVDAAQQLFP
jgi:cytochrome c biogenesis protein CcdA